MRPEELRGRKGRKQDGSARTREAKLGCVFTQTDLDAQGNPLRDEDGCSLRALWCHEMKHSSPIALLAESRALLNANPDWHQSKRDAIQNQINYLESHSTRTHYGRYRQEGLFIGSGVVEAGCKTVVGRRLKQSGMFWSQTGAENILSLRCLVLGQNFDDAWKELKTINAIQQLKARRWENPDIKLAA